MECISESICVGVDVGCDVCLFLCVGVCADTRIRISSIFVRGYLAYFFLVV